MCFICLQTTEGKLTSQYFVTKVRSPPLWILFTVALFPSPGRLTLFIVMSSSRARYGLIASPPSFRISLETPSGPNDLYFLIAPTLLLKILISKRMVRLCFLPVCVEYCPRCWIPSNKVNKRNWIFLSNMWWSVNYRLWWQEYFPYFLYAFYISVELSPAFTLFD